MRHAPAAKPAPRRLDFAAPSFETTVRTAADFARHAARLPPGSVVNLAHVEQVDLGQRLAAIDLLGAAGLAVRPIISTRRVPSEAWLRRLLHEVVDRRGLAPLVVGGDPQHPAGPYATALQLLESAALRGHRPVLIGLPGFPGHHPALDPERLLENLAAKVAAVQRLGARAEITTQVCLDPHAVLDWLAAVRAAGIRIPVRIGIPAPCPAGRLVRFLRLCRVPGDGRTLHEHGWVSPADAAAADPGRFLTVLLEGLHGRQPDVRVHAYPMGDMPGTLHWLHEAARVEAG